MTALERVELMASNPAAYAAFHETEGRALDARIKALHDRTCDKWETWTERHRIDGEPVVITFDGCRQCKTGIQR